MCTIVVPQEDQLVLEAAKDLQYHLKKMSGAEVPVVHNASKVQGVGIYIDTMPLNASVPGKSIDPKDLWPDGYVIEFIDWGHQRGVCLSSPCPGGLSNAVYGLLEDYLGCHWFTPGTLGEHIPQRKTVVLEFPRGQDIVRPSFEKRKPWYNGSALGMMSTAEVGEIATWYRRNRAGGPLGAAAHNWGFFEHPDTYAMFAGKRQAGIGLCMSSPKAVEVASDVFIRFFNSHPEYNHWSFCQGDSLKWCECDRCAAMGSNNAARMLIMSNRVAENLAKVHPTKRLTIYAYQGTLNPPKESIEAHPNLIPIIISMGVDQIRAKPDSPHFRQQVGRWMKVLPRAWSYDYVGWSNGPWPLFHTFQKTRDFYRKMGYTGVMDEFLSRNLGTDTLLWLSLQTAWDSDRRVTHLLNDFYPAYFGPAGEDMRWIYERLEKQMISVGTVGSTMGNVPHLYPPNLVNKCLARIVTAKKKLGGDPVLIARIERDENCLKATSLWLRFREALGAANHSREANDRLKATTACQTYLKFLDSLKGKNTLSGKHRVRAEQTLKALTGSGTYFSKQGTAHYWDTLDQGGKSFHAKSCTGFKTGLLGLYLSPNDTGEIIYDMQAGKGLRFQRAFLPTVSGLGGWDTALRMALPRGGNNKIQVSLDHSQTWITIYQDVQTDTRKTVYELTPYVRGKNQFLLKFSVQNGEDRKILAMNCWVFSCEIE